MNSVSPAPPVPAEPAPVRGLRSWLAVVRSYQKCTEVMAKQLKPLGLKLSEHDVLLSLLLSPPQAEPISQQHLAENSFVTKSHMSGVLTEMADKGWVERTDSQNDKRSKLISLTPAGLLKAQEAFAVQSGVVAVMMGPLSERQIQELEAVSRNATAALSKLLD